MTSPDSRFDPITGEVVPVFLHYAIPSVIGMLAVTSAGIIDGIFIGNYVGSTALAAVNISMPAWAVFAAVVFMLAVGGSVRCGKYLGEGNGEAASAIFSKTVIAIFALGVLISGLCLLFLDQVVTLLGANQELHGLVRSYMQIILYFAPVLIVALTLDYFVRADGRPLLASAALVSFAVLNIGLNWLFIGQWGWGIEGAAWATALAESFIFFILLVHWFSPRCSLKLVAVREGWGELLSAAWNGFSEFANELSIGLVTLLFNWVMITRLGVEGVAAFTIIGYLLMIGIEVSYGIAESMQPTVSKNLGARQPKRIKQFIMTGLITSSAVGLLVSALFLLAPNMLVTAFLSEGEQATEAIALAFIAVFWPAFLFNGMNITLSSCFTALHKPIPSAVIAVMRSLVLPVAGLMLLPRWFGDTGVFMAIPLSEALTFVVAMALMLRYRSAEIDGDQ